ncbi:MAG: TonB family protein [Deltaproteobacteria bacterium]|nr:TonB family protein [Deltaproteobacteria bacterium]
MNRLLPGLLLFNAIWLHAMATAAAQKVQDESQATADTVKDAADASSADENAMVPPKLITYVEAEYPPEAFEKGLQADVLATLDIDATGNVVDVEINEPVGNGFDEAAKAAMMKFKFEPATVNGKVTPCLLQYRYRFVLKYETPAAAGESENDTDSAKTSGVSAVAFLGGRVTDMDENAVGDALIYLSGQFSDPVTGAKTTVDKEGVTAEDGTFRFTDLASGMYEITIQASGYQIYYGGEELIPGESKDITYRLVKETTAYEVVVRARREPRSVTRREITALEITKLPGTDGDALRAVQNMPGTARPSMGGGEIIVRGSKHADSGFYYDNVEAPWLYHFGGLTSVINSDLLENIDFYPGNFSVRYGRATGGIIDVQTRAPKSDRFHGYIDVDVWDASILLEGPVSKNWSVAVSGRRSYIDAILSNIDFGDDFKMKAAPRYYDFQLIADYHPNDRNNLRLFFFGTDDKMIFIYDNEENPNRGGGDDVHLMAYQGQLEWKYQFSDRISNTLDFGVGYWGGKNAYGNYEEKWNVVPTLLRDELGFKISKEHELSLGVDMKLEYATIDMAVPGDYYVEGSPDFNDSAHDNKVFITGNRFAIKPAVYTEYKNTMIPRTTLVLGLRTDYFGNVDRWSVDPRFAARYQLFKNTTVKTGIGLFHQAPDYAEGDKDYGNPDLELTRALHTSLGIEQKLSENVELSVEGFYKKLDNVVTASDDPQIRDGQMDIERFDNEGRGHIWGMEAMLKHNPTDRFFGWVSYTLMKSIRKDGANEPWRTFDKDQRHVLNAVGTLNLGRGYSIGLRFRLVSGDPYTPVTGGIYDADSDNYTPVYGKVNSKRMAMFHQLDVRFDKKWQWTHLALTAYLDVKNVYNHQNPEFPVYSSDFSEKDWLTGLPILPSVGVKLEY